MKIQGYEMEINELDINAIKAFRAWENANNRSELFLWAAWKFGAHRTLKTRALDMEVTQFFGKIYGI